MSYDAWKTETDRDYEDRMQVHHRGPSEDAPGGLCACGADTVRSVGGIGWQCHACGQKAFEQLYAAGVRKHAS